jgi:hypothetical protein
VTIPILSGPIFVLIQSSRGSAAISLHLPLSVV